MLKVKEPIDPSIGGSAKGSSCSRICNRADEPLTRALIGRGSPRVAYETVEVGGTLPLLAPMS